MKQVWMDDDGNVYEPTPINPVWLIIMGIIWTFIAGSTATITSVMATGFFLREKEIAFGSRLIEGAGPLVGAMIVSFVLAIICGRISYQMHVISYVHIFLGISIFILSFSHPKNVVLGVLIAFGVSLVLGITLSLILIYKEIAIIWFKKKPLAGTFVGLISVIISTCFIAMDCFLLCAEETDRFDYIPDGQEVAVLTDYAKNYMLLSLIIGLVCGAISVLAGFIIKKNKD